MKHAMRGRNCFGQEVPAIGQMAVWDLKPAKIYTDYISFVVYDRTWHPVDAWYVPPSLPPLSIGFA